MGRGNPSRGVEKKNEKEDEMETLGIVVFLTLLAWGLWTVDRGLASGRLERDASSSEVPHIPWY
jgi:hypothetical protein